MLEERVLWAHSPKPEYELDEDWADRYYIPARVLCLARPGKDLVVLPRCEEVEGFASFCQEVLGLSPQQIVWTSGRSYLLDDDIRRELLPKLKELVANRWVIAPYSVTGPFLRWARELDVPIFGDREEWVRRWANKGILHPTPGRGDREVPLLTNLVSDLRVPRGYYCRNHGELRRGLELLQRAGVKKFIVKPALGATGEGIRLTPPEEIEAYSFPMGSVVLEEFLKVEASPSIQYLGRRVFGEPTDQLIGEFSHEGNVVPSSLPEEVQEEILDVTRKVIGVISPQGPGGLDFLIVGGRAYLTDPNLGRFTGAHPPKIFRNLWAPRSGILSWERIPTVELDSFWQCLESKSIAFHPGRDKEGVFPLCFLRQMWGLFVALSGEREREEMFSLREEAEECLS